MVDLFGVAVFVFFFPWSLWFGYQAVTVATLYWTLSGSVSGSARGIGDGESAAIEGDVIVDEPADASDKAVEGTDSPIAAYLWRAAFPRTGANVIDFENREVKQGKATFASGIESGEFTVADGRQSIRIDPDWLVKTHGATELRELSVGGVTRSRSFHTYLWDSPYIYLTGDVTEVSLDRMLDTVNKHNSGVDLDDYCIELKPIPEGESLAVHGEARVGQGDMVIQGTDETPLLISNQGFSSLGSELRTRTAKYSFFSVVLLAVAVFFVF